MSNLAVHFSSETDDWATPQEVFDLLNAEFGFTLDPCASDTNRKCDKYYTVDDDGLTKDWGGERVFCNPPYGREMPKWVEKASREAMKPGTLVVLLIPARTDTRYFHDYLYRRAELRFIKGRLKFGNATTSAPFPSMIAVLGG